MLIFRAYLSYSVKLSVWIWTHKKRKDNLKSKMPMSNLSFDTKTERRYMKAPTFFFFHSLRWVQWIAYFITQKRIDSVTTDSKKKKQS